jgi:hypothetical protein
MKRPVFVLGKKLCRKSSNKWHSQIKFSFFSAQFFVPPTKSYSLANLTTETKVHVLSETLTASNTQ